MMGIQTFSRAHYQPGDRVVVASIGASWNATSLTDPGKPTGVVSQLAWFDLEWNGPVPEGGVYNPWSPSQVTSPLPLAAPCSAASGCATEAASASGGWGILARDGDPNSAGAPNWSHDGTTIAYSSTDVGTKDGRMNCSDTTTPCKSDVVLVPYNDGKGGAAQPLAGASDPAFNEYYPAFSPDDEAIAFNRVPAGTSMYNQPKAEVYVVGASGSQTPIRLAGNDPAACTGLTSPGVQNTWPKWAPGPSVGTDGKTYYWITFSSSRSPLAKGKQQLYVSAVVKDVAGTITTYPAIYLWNQDATVNNLIPAWDNFAINHGDAGVLQ
jgi:hypothetical protein